MNLKHMAAAKLLCSNWSSTKLDHLLEQTDIRMSRALDYVMPNNIKVSCVQLSLKAELPFKDCMELILANVNTAVADGTQLIVFPEYIGLLPILSSPSIFDLCYQFSEDLINQDREAVEEVLHFYSKYLAQPLLESYLHFFSLLAIKSSVYILAGSIIVKTREGFVNRSFLFDPDGNVVLHQDKLHLSPAEKFCGLIAGKSISVAQTKLCRMAILTGMDQRVYEAANAAHLMGAQLLLCPSAFCESNSSEYFQSCSFMRCQEQPVFAISSWLTGDFMDLPFRAISGIYAPFSASKMGNGIIMQTERPTANACLTARIDLERLSQDPDLYISDINPIIEEMARKEYALARQTKPSGAEDNVDMEEEEANSYGAILSDEGFSEEQQASENAESPSNAGLSEIEDILQSEPSEEPSAPAKSRSGSDIPPAIQFPGR